jgi:hypothetical protein
VCLSDHRLTSTTVKLSKFRARVAKDLLEAERAYNKSLERAVNVSVVDDDDKC